MAEQAGAEGSAYGTELEAVFVNLSSPQEILPAEKPCVPSRKDSCLFDDVSFPAPFCLVEGTHKDRAHD